MLNQNPFINYLKERFQIIPWVVLSFIVAVYSFGTWEYFSFKLSALTVVIFMAYRLNDDIMCMNIDIAKGKIREFHKNIPSLIKWKNLLIVIMLVSSGVVLEINAFYLVLSLTILSFLLYYVLKNSKYLELISILKYPVIIGAIEYTQKGIVSYWPLIFFIVFLSTELYELQTKNKKLAQKIQMISILLILTLRIGVAYK